MCKSFTKPWFSRGLGENGFPQSEAHAKKCKKQKHDQSLDRDFNVGHCWPNMPDRTLANPTVIELDDGKIYRKPYI